MQERDYVNQVVRNPLLSYVMLHVIDKFQRDTYVAPEVLAQLCAPLSNDDTERRVLTPQRFYRILYLIHRKCQKKGVDLKLPYYWYKSGPVVHARSAPQVYKITRLQKTQQAIASYAQWKETVLVVDGFESAYSDAVLLTEHARQLGGLSKLDIIYEYSPSHTHKLLTTLVNELSRIHSGSVLKGRQKKLILSLLERLILESWDKKYDDLYPALIQEADNLRDKVHEGENAASLSSAVTTLWNVFTLALRAKENSNIDSKTTRKWNETYSGARYQLEQQLGL